MKFLTYAAVLLASVAVCISLYLFTVTNREDPAVIEVGEIAWMGAVIEVPSVALHSTPLLAIRAEYNYEWLSKQDVSVLLDANSVFAYLNLDEIQKTLEVVEFHEDGDLGIAFYRYSVGTRVFRKTLWLRNMGGYWFRSGVYISLYTSNIPEYKSTQPNWKFRRWDWLIEMKKKEEDWKNDSTEIWE